LKGDIDLTSTFYVMEAKRRLNSPIALHWPSAALRCLVRFSHANWALHWTNTILRIVRFLPPSETPAQ